ncbi:hypothetical protein ILUMI_11334, partial [Ignelater luminosus]
HSYQARVRHAVSFVVFSCRLSLYCIPANYIINKALTVSDAVYSSKWYFQEFSRLKATLLLMIQSSQNGITVKAGGLITINAETIVKACSKDKRVRGSVAAVSNVEGGVQQRMRTSQIVVVLDLVSNEPESSTRGIACLVGVTIYIHIILCRRKTLDGQSFSGEIDQRSPVGMATLFARPDPIMEFYKSTHMPNFS